ncbi:hypothetical protein CR513_49493, partial [Mucuna pruriens]
MKAFPFSLDLAAKDWLYLLPVMFTTWGDMKQMFLEKFSLVSSLLMKDRNMVDVASRGALMDKTLMVARHLISNMASNTQQFGVRGGAGTSKVVSKVGAFDNLRLENQLTKLTSLVRQFAVGQHQQAVQRVCGICTSIEHPIEICPTLK